MEENGSFDDNFDFVPGFDEEGERCISKAIVNDGTEIAALIVDDSAVRGENNPYEVIRIEGSNRIIIAISKDFVEHLFEQSPSKEMAAFTVGTFVGQVVTDVARDVIEETNNGSFPRQNLGRFDYEIREEDE